MLQVNEVIVHQGIRYRVLDVNPEYLYLIDIDDDKGLPNFLSFDVFLEWANTGEVSREEDPFSYLHKIAFSSDSIKSARLEQKFAIIKPIVEHKNVMDKKVRASLIGLALKDSNKPKSTLYRLLRRYWQRGQIKNALLPDYGKNLVAGKRRNFTSKKPGQVRVYGIGKGAIVTDEVRKMFATIMDKYLLTEKAHTIAYAHRKFQEAYLFKYPITPEYEIPTYRQLQFFYRTEIGASERLQARTPENSYNKDVKPTTGTATEQALGPGSRYEIDATIADLYLVHDDDASIILGRPTIYMVIDVFSRMVAGFYIGFDSPSYPIAMKALVCSFGSKVNSCKQYGIDISDEQWPCIGVPDVLLADRGELMSHQANYLIDALRVRLEIAPPRRGDAKGIVERSFGTFQAVFKDYVPGVVEGNKVKKHGETDYRLEATLSKSDFIEIILYSILAHNLHKPLEKYDRGEDIPTDIPSVPIALWNWGLANRSGKLKTVDMEIATVRLLPRHKVSLSDKGVKLWGVIYTCSNLLKTGWLHRAPKISRPQNLLASYDIGNANQIYLYPDPSSHEYWVCDLTSRSREYQDMTWRQVWQRQYDFKQTMSNTKYNYAPFERDLDKLIEDKVAQAKQRYKHSASDASRIKAIKNNKREAIEQERAETAIKTKLVSSENKADVISITKPEDDYQYPSFTPELFDRDDE